MKLIKKYKLLSVIVLLVCLSLGLYIFVYETAFSACASGNHEQIKIVHVEGMLNLKMNQDLSLPEVWKFIIKNKIFLTEIRGLYDTERSFQIKVPVDGELCWINLLEMMPEVEYAVYENISTPFPY